MAQARFDFPDFPGWKNARKGRILAQALTFLGFGGQHAADLLKRPRQQHPPLFVTLPQGRHAIILTSPSLQVGTCQVEPLRAPSKLARDPSPQLQAHRIDQLMAHVEKLPQNAGRSRATCVYGWTSRIVTSGDGAFQRRGRSRDAGQAVPLSSSSPGSRPMVRLTSCFPRRPRTSLSKSRAAASEAA